MTQVRSANGDGGAMSRRNSLKFCLGAGTVGLFACAAVRPAQAGWGRCSKDSCAGFKEDYRNKDVCENCGHNYTDHW